jgi:nucleoside-diphosphate-sugar epimerase
MSVKRLKVLVTGGIGLVGRAVVTHLLDMGYPVRILDRKPEPEVRAGEDAEIFARAEYVQGDINDFTDLVEKVRGCEQIAHMAAIPNPVGSPPEAVFQVNATGTFNVFQAAAVLGIRRVSQASSINAIGLHYGVVPAEPHYFPVDEDHPPAGTDAYSFSKWVIEEIGDFFWRREGISSVALRFPSVFPAHARQWAARRREANLALIEMVYAMSEIERSAWLDGLLEMMKELRAHRKMEDPAFQRSMFGPTASMPEDQRRRMIPMMMRDNFWTHIDARDAAQAVEKGLSAPYEGAHALFVNNSNNGLGIESEELARIFYPAVTQRKSPLVGTQSLVSIERARKLIGFEPQFEFADAISQT